MPSFRILIVEQQREVSRLLHSALVTLKQDLEIIESPSGEEALLETLHDPVDLLVCDYLLPGMDGVELMEKIRKRDPEVKAIFIAGQNDEKIRSRVVETGGDAFFLKPVPMADFLDRVERLLGLVESSLPPEPITIPMDKETRRNLPDLMANLRQELEAVVVYFLNETGDVVARAGDVPDSHNEASLLASLLVIHGAGRKVTQILGGNVTSNWHVFEGSTMDLIYAPVTKNYSMLVMGENLADGEVIVENAEKFNATRRKILETLEGPTREIPATLEPQTTPRDAILSAREEMEPLFAEAEKKIKTTDVDDFWDKAVEKHKSASKPDRLSYDQAKKIGLAPENKT